jgi:hypothetical protein
VTADSSFSSGTGKAASNNILEGVLLGTASWFEKTIFGVGEAYAQTTPPPSGTATAVFYKNIPGMGPIYNLNISITNPGSGMGSGAQVAIQFINGTRWVNQPYAPTIQLLITDNTVSNILVKFEDVAGNWSTPITVAIPKAAPSITTQPANATVTAPAAASFTAAATGTPTPTYQWEVSTDGGSTWSAISGATSASYTTACKI